jgi:hypothetical protein
MALLYVDTTTRTGLHRTPPELWPRLGGEEVRGPSSEAVSAGVADTAADFAAESAGAADSAAVVISSGRPIELAKPHILA